MRVGESRTRVVLASVTLLGHSYVSGTEGNDNGAAGGGLGLNIVGIVVSVVAGEGHAARDGGLGVSRVHLVDTSLVLRVDDGGDIKVGGARIAVECKLGQHTRCVGGTAGVRVRVASPAIRDGNIDRLAGRDRSIFDLSSAGPDDGAVGAVHGLEGDGVGGAHHRGQGGNSKVLELHDCWFFGYIFWI